MAGRAFEYMNQNIGLAQSGLDRATQMPAAYRQDVTWRQQQEDRQRALDEANSPATDVEKFVGNKLAQQIEAFKKEGEARVANGENPQQVATETKVKIHLAQQQDGGMPSGPTQVQMPSSASVHSQHRATLEKLGMARSIGAEASPSPGMPDVPPSNTTVQLPGYDAGGLSVAPRDLPAQSVSSERPSFLVTKSPEASKPGLPEVKTRKDLAALYRGNEELARWKQAGTGLTFEQRQALEGQKQEGMNKRKKMDYVRAELDRKATNERAQLAADTSKYGVQMRYKQFMQSTQQIDNAKQLLQKRMNFVAQLSKNNQLDANKRAALAAQAKKLATIMQTRAQLQAAYVQSMADEGKDNPGVWDTVMELDSMVPYEMSSLDEQINELMSDVQGDGMGGLNSRVSGSSVQ